MEESRTVEELITGIKEELRKRNSCKTTMDDYCRCWKDLNKIAISNEITIYTIEFGNNYLKTKFDYPDSNPKGTYVLKYIRAINLLNNFYLFGSIISHSGKKDLNIPNEFKDATSAYEKYCKRRNNSDETIHRGKDSLLNFYSFLMGKGINDINYINAQHISEYISTKLSFGKKAIYRHIQVLKALLYSLYLEGQTKDDMSLAIPRLTFSDADFSPPVWSKDEINRILSSIDCGSPVGKRDYAMILLVVRTGIRNSDLRNLKLTDINWDARKIEFIQVKTKQPLALPLLEDVGWAIIDYLKNGRPSTACPNVFVSNNKPYCEFKTCFYRLKEYLNNAGIAVPVDKSKGIHALRHSLVNRLLEEKVPSDTISAILGHMCPESIKSYLHTDINTLKSCALEVPKVKSL